MKYEEAEQLKSYHVKNKAKYCIVIGNVFLRFNKQKKLKLVEKKCTKCGTIHLVKNLHRVYDWCQPCLSSIKSFNTTPNILHKDCSAERMCLRCGKKFNSKGPWNRTCVDCQYKNEHEIIQTKYRLSEDGKKSLEDFFEEESKVKKEYV